MSGVMVVGFLVKMHIILMVAITAVETLDAQN